MGTMKAKIGDDGMTPLRIEAGENGWLGPHLAVLAQMADGEYRAVIGIPIGQLLSPASLACVQRSIAQLPLGADSGFAARCVAAMEEAVRDMHAPLTDDEARDLIAAMDDLPCWDWEEPRRDDHIADDRQVFGDEVRAVAVVRQYLPRLARHPDESIEALKRAMQAPKPEGDAS